jgi:hypothetical protein
LHVLWKSCRNGGFNFPREPISALGRMWRLLPADRAQIYFFPCGVQWYLVPAVAAWKMNRTNASCSILSSLGSQNTSNLCLSCSLVPGGWHLRWLPGWMGTVLSLQVGHYTVAALWVAPGFWGPTNMCLSLPALLVPEVTEARSCSLVFWWQHRWNIVHTSSLPSPSRVHHRITCWLVTNGILLK